MPKQSLLLISNSKPFGGGYLDHCAQAIQSMLSPHEVSSILFFPFALADHDGYTRTVRERFGRMGIEVTGAHQARDLSHAIEEAQAFFIGGGNTFRLLNALDQEDTVWPDRRTSVGDHIREKVQAGTPYIGTSAGANVACPTIQTTNDMPIVEPDGFYALDLVPFQINPHYLDPDPTSRHMGETRETRIKEYHEENATPVIGLREGAWLHIDGAKTYLQGTSGAKLFRRGKQPRELENGLINPTFLNP